MRSGQTRGRSPGLVSTAPVPRCCLVTRSAHPACKTLVAQAPQNLHFPGGTPGLPAAEEAGPPCVPSVTLTSPLPGAPWLPHTHTSCFIPTLGIFPF